MRKKLRAFTLLELMAVVAIIAVLSVVAVVSYKKYQAKARLMQGYGYINQLRVKEEMYYASYSQYVSTGADLTAFYPSSSPQFEQAWGIDCSNAGGLASKGFCALGFSPGNKTDWAFVTVGWYPNYPTSGSNHIPISDSTKPWWVIRVMTPGTMRASSADTTTDCYQLRATSETQNIFEQYCSPCGSCKL